MVATALQPHLPGRSSTSTTASTVNAAQASTLETLGTQSTAAESQRISDLQDKFQQQAKQDPAGFRSAMREAFGDKASLAQIDQLLDLALAGKLPMPANIQFVEAGSLGSDALGAYDSSNGGSLYLDRSLLSDPEKLESVFNEEMGHHLDALLGGADAAGDEGAVFSQTLEQGTLSQSELTALRSENDHGYITVDGETVAVEFRNEDEGSGNGQSPSPSPSPSPSYSGPGSSPGTGGSPSPSPSPGTGSGGGGPPGTGGGGPPGTGGGGPPGTGGGGPPGTGGGGPPGTGGGGPPGTGGGGPPGTGGGGPPGTGGGGPPGTGGGGPPGTGGDDKDPGDDKEAGDGEDVGNTGNAADQDRAKSLTDTVAESADSAKEHLERSPDMQSNSTGLRGALGYAAGAFGKLFGGLSTALGFSKGYDEERDRGGSKADAVREGFREVALDVDDGVVSGIGLTGGAVAVGTALTFTPAGPVGTAVGAVAGGVGGANLAGGLYDKSPLDDGFDAGVNYVFDTIENLQNRE